MELRSLPRTFNSLVSLPFFDSATNRGHAGNARRLRAQRMEPRRALSPDRDAELLVALQLACVDHRRMLFQLGEQHGIKLHYGACLSMTELVVTLYLYWLNVDPASARAATRDRFILSKGHAAPSLYIALLQAGFVGDDAFR